MAGFKDISIKRKLQAIITATALIALLLSYLAFFSYDLAWFRKSMRSDLAILADLIGANSTAALTFNDAKSAREILLGLKAQPHIVAACIYSGDGTIFARYIRDAGQGQIPTSAPGIAQAFFSSDRLKLFHRIILDGQPIGTVYLESDLQEMHLRVTRYIGILALIILASTLLAFLLSSRLQRVISDPILRLADTARVLSMERDYSVRAVKTGQDEVGYLIDGFNRMLEQIQLRDKQLKRHRDHLEEEVARRTAELTSINAQLVESKEKAEEASRAKSRFLANMSHELRTPLNAVLGYAQILKGEKTVSERQAAGLKIIEKSGYHLLTLINEILDLSKIEAGKLELRPGVIDLPAFLATIVDIIRQRAEQKRLLFTCETSADLPLYVELDEKRLRQVLLNLLANAVKLTDRGGVTLRVGPPPGSGSVQATAARSKVRLRFEVEDTGIGMTPQQMARIFALFEQVSDVERREGGTGLGLVISQQLVRMMGGDIHVRSEAGQGSNFWFELALSVATQGPPALSGGPVVTGYFGPRKRVLVVDDVPENRAVLANLLNPLGFEIFEACDGQEGLTQAQTVQPDLILMDIKMPVMDGKEATHRLRQIPALKRVPIIALSASATSEDEKQSMAGGADAFLPKPVELSCLLKQIDTYLKPSWAYGQAEEDTVPETKVAEVLVPPPPEEMEVLHQLAMLGNMRDICQRAAHVATLGEHYGPFSEKLAQLAQGFQSKAILSLVEQYMNGGSG